MYQYTNYFDKINNLLEQNFFSWVDKSHEIEFPFINLREEKEQLKLDVLLPGIKNEDIELTIKEKILIIEGEKKNENIPQEINRIRQERTYGKFRRVISLPSNIEADKAKAVFKNGILSIALEKKEQEKAKKITIQ